LSQLSIRYYSVCGKILFRLCCSFPPTLYEHFKEQCKFCNTSTLQGRFLLKSNKQGLRHRSQHISSGIITVECFRSSWTLRAECPKRCWTLLQGVLILQEAGTYPSQFSLSNAIPCQEWPNALLPALLETPSFFAASALMGRCLIQSKSRV
jgi:hypothetical protein